MPLAPQGPAPYCGEAPPPEQLFGRWNLDPYLLAALILLTLLLWNAGPRGDSSRRPFTIGAALISILLFVTPFCALTSALFAARVVHHVLLTAVLAPLIVFSIPRSQSPNPGSLAAWTVVQAVVFWIWHSPPLYSTALSDDLIYWVMQTTMTGSSVAFWLALRRAAPTAAVGSLLATMVQMGLLGALITFAGKPLYSPHFLSTKAWGLSALEDQQLAGLIMWAPSAAIYLGAALLIVAQWLRLEKRQIA